MVDANNGVSGYFESFILATMIRLTVTEYLCHKWSRVCSVYRNPNPVLFSFITVNQTSNISNKMVQELLSFQEHLSSHRVFKKKYTLWQIM